MTMCNAFAWRASAGGPAFPGAVVTSTASTASTP